MSHSISGTPVSRAPRRPRQAGLFTPPSFDFGKEIAAATEKLISELSAAGDVRESGARELLKEKFGNIVSSLVGGVVSTLQSEFATQRNRLDVLDQNSRSMNLCVFGIPEGKGEEPEIAFLEWAKVNLEIDLSTSGVTRAKRVGKPRMQTALDTQQKSPKKAVRPRPIVVTFSKFNDRMSVFKAKSKLKGSEEKFMVCEDLTATRRDMLYELKQMFGFRNVWTSGGIIHFRDAANPEDAARVHSVTTPEEMEFWKMQKKPTFSTPLGQ